MARRVGPRPGLDEAAVVYAAADLIDAEGMEALALARLAERLGVRPPSLYNHVASLEALRRGLALLGMRELTAHLARSAVGRSGADGILALAHAYRRFARQRPGLYAAAQRAPAPDDEALTQASVELMDLVRAVLAPHGPSNAREIHQMRALRSLVHGFVSLETAGGFGLPVDLDESFNHLVHLFISSLDAQLAPPDRRA